MGTKLGKALVYLNLILALGLATIAVGIYTNRINWSGKATADEQEGVQARLRSEIQHYQELYGMARQHWERSYVALQRIEAVRPVEQRWQMEQLSLLETGLDLDAKPVEKGAVKQFVYDANGRLQLEANGRPKMMIHPNPDLKPYAIMAQEIRGEDDKIGELIKEVNGLISKEEELTFFLDGKPGEAGKGLYGLLAELETARKLSLQEADFIRPLSVNRNIEADSLQARRNQLLLRIAELNRKLGVAAARQP